MVRCARLLLWTLSRQMRLCLIERAPKSFADCAVCPCGRSIFPSLNRVSGREDQSLAQKVMTETGWRRCFWMDPMPRVSPVSGGE